MLLIHAGVADHRMWDDQFSVFAEHYRTIRYDTRGFGRSVTEDVPFSNHHDVTDLLDHLGVQRAHVIGASRAGAIALNVTLAYPHRVRGLVLVAAGMGGHDARQGEPDDERALWPVMEALEETKDFDALVDMEVKGVGRRSAPARGPGRRSDS